MKIITLTSFFCCFTISLFSQFFYTQVAPDSIYRVNTTTSQINTGQIIDINNSDESFTIAAWINLRDRSCTNFFFGTNNIQVLILTASEPGYQKLRFSIKDSIVVEATQFTDEFMSLIPLGEQNLHFAVTYGGGGTVGDMKMYINGTQLTNVTVTSNSISGSIPEEIIKIGSATCEIDVYNLKVWSQDLTKEQIKLEAKEFGRISASNNYIYEGTESYKKSGFKSTFFQKWKIPTGGRLISIPLFDGGVDFSGRFFTDLSLYNNGKYYVPVDIRDGPSYSREIVMMVYDTETNNIEIVSETTKTPNELSKDIHRVGAMQIGKDGSLVLAYEDRHNKDYYVFKSTFPLNNPIPEVANIVGNNLNAYANLWYLRDTLYLTGRQQFDEQILYRSLDDGATWSGVLDTISQVDANYWNYASTVTVGDSIIYLIGNARNSTLSSNGGFEKLYLLKSTDANTWCNIGENLCQSTKWTWSNINQYALIDTTTNDIDFTVCYQAFADSAGTVHLFYYNQLVGYNIHTTVTLSGEISKDTLTWSVADRTNPPKFIWKGGSSFDVWQIETDGSEEVLKKYQSSDNLQTVDTGTVIYRTTYDLYRSVLPPFNQAVGQEVLLVLPVIINTNIDKEGLFIYNYNPWE